MGLETNATVESDITLSSAADPPLTPILGSVNPSVGGLTGGTYMYVMTKTYSAGETLSSDVLPVTVGYDKTYSVVITFDALSTYVSDSPAPTGLNIYRSAGLNSAFQLVGQIADVNQVSFTDNNVSVDQTAQPPSTSTYDTTKQTTIDWSSLSPYPTGAVALNIYITQQSGIWGNEHLLSTIDLTQSTPPTNLSYQGSETLNSGYPLEGNQIPSQPPQIDLGTQATGGFVLTANGNFQQHQAKNIVIDNTSSSPASPINGQIYYDTSINNMRAYINGSWTNWGVTAGTSYTHPTEEIGGHLASHIRWISGSDPPDLYTMLQSFFDTTAGARKQNTTVVTKQGPSNPISTSSSTPTTFDSLTIPAPEFNNQWYVVTFRGNVVYNNTNPGDIVTIRIQLGGTTVTGTSRPYPLASVTDTPKAIFISSLVQIPSGGGTLNFQWSVNTSGLNFVSMVASSYYLTAYSLP